MNSKQQILLLTVLTALFIAPHRTAADEQKAFFDLSIEELGQIEVTSVARKSQKASEAASAVYVLTSEDIRRSGAASIPEALRLVPGVQVARIDSNRYAISSRGFNNAFALKLLVMIDGRTVYNPLFSGVIWDTQDVLLEDIERIEVIRGPGASLWGPNAVNGVISVITKSSTQTQGGYAMLGAGKEERFFGGARYGAEVGDLAYRLYTKYFNRDEFVRVLEGGSANDAWSGYQGGFRTDYAPSDAGILTVQGDAFRLGEDNAFDAIPVVALFEPSYMAKVHQQGGNILARWTRTFSPASELQLQTYYDYVDREDGVLNHNYNTADIDLQHRFAPIARHDFLWGAGVRHYKDSTQGSFDLSFAPDDRSMNLYTAFVQDDITIIDERLHLIAGSKLEHNVFTGLEYQPTLRGVWTPDSKQTVWAALSRATRTPSRLENDASTVFGGTPGGQNGMPVLVRAFGSQETTAEKVHAYEAGYRIQPAAELSFDIAAFYNDYTDHLSFDPAQPPSLQSDPLPHFMLPVSAGNNIDFRSHGAELTINWNPVERWRLIGTYAYLNIDFAESSTTTVDALRMVPRENPDHQFSVRSLLTITESIEFDTIVRYTEGLAINLDPLDPSGGKVPEYAELDLRLGWRPQKDLDLSLIGRNLLHPEHSEWYQTGFGQPIVQIERAVYLRGTYRF